MAGVGLLAIALPSAGVALQDEIRPIETTTAYELLTLERSVRQVPTNAEELLRSILIDITNKVLNVHRHPQTREEALAVLEVIQLALVKHNFLQPSEEEDWPQTLGIAFTPRTLTPAALSQVLRHYHNVRRAQYIDLAKPIYFVDCDMGSQIFIAVGELAGWDIRLVEVPNHNFVRWHLSETIKVNWDWTRWESSNDSDYFVELSDGDHRLRSFYLRSLEPAETKAYYTGLIGSEASLPSDAERLLQEAVKVLPNHPLTLNNLAWLYATTPEFARYKGNLAVSFGLAAWSMRPLYGVFADTVACAFAANGSLLLAERIEEFALEHANSPMQRESFRKNRDQIGKGKLCNP